MSRLSESLDQYGMPIVEAKLSAGSELEQFYLMANREETEKFWEIDAKEEFEFLDQEEVEERIEGYFNGANWEFGMPLSEGYPDRLSNQRLWDEVFSVLDRSTDNALDDFQFDIIRSVPEWKQVEIPISDILFTTPDGPDSITRISQYTKLKTPMPPVILYKDAEDDSWTIVDGYHRIATAKKLGRTKVTAYVPAE